VFKKFKDTEDSSYLLSQVMSTSEEMIQSLYETNFSNIEIGALYKLRRQRS